jgi:hypothetical protein
MEYYNILGIIEDLAYTCQEQKGCTISESDLKIILKQNLNKSHN